jgi:arabinan endo-1,5-alpha-L-arabinosidase
MSNGIQIKNHFPGGTMRQMSCRLFLVIMMEAFGTGRVAAQLPVYGNYHAHDPSRIIKQDGTYYVFYTSQGIVKKTSTDLRNWTDGSPIFPGNPPSWTTNAVPGFTGVFWAPDVIYLNGTNYLYYSVSSFGSQVSAIGLVTTTNLASGPWIDQGAVIQSVNGNAYNCIDPCPLVDTNGTMWLTFGSYWNGIYLVQLDPATGKRISANSTLTWLAYNSSIEASYLYQHGGYYYLFVNWNTCCSGIDSTYNIRLGRSTSVTGPYLDRNEVNLVIGGGSMFLESTARFIGPGHAGILNDNGINWFTYHYYDGNNNGVPTLGLNRLFWSPDDWPVLTNDWSAFYTFDVDAREHLGLYNGMLHNGASITNEPSRGNVLNLDGTTNFVSFPLAVANASTFAAWVKWNGGADWQRVFDFGSNTTKYLFLTPRASSGKMRFAIKNGGAEQTIDAPSAMPTNSWCHVAVSLDGAKGILYLNGSPVGTNSTLTIRPWQLLARSNYVGESPFTANPFFSGRVDSLRIFGRALGGAEIRDLAWAHPALAHRYSFNSNTSNVWDSIGMAHGTLMGNATIANNALHLTGASGGYVNLPGGLVSDSSAVTLEFWATLGTSGNWARVVDFGNISGSSGQNYFFFSPHTSTNGQRMEMKTSTTTTFDITGTLDNRALHVVCIVDPANNYAAVYTNGALEKTLSSAWPAFTSVSTAWSFIGRSLFSLDAYLNATIDELRLYDGRLTEEEIATDYKFGPDALALPVTLMQSNSAAGLTLSWPSWAAGFALQTTTNLAGQVWTTNGLSPALANDRWSLVISTTNTPNFYRLQR